MSQPIANVDYVADGVYISSARAQNAVGAIRRAGIQHVLKLYFYEPHWPDDFTVCEMPIVDGEFIRHENIERGVGFIREQVDAERRVLVQCGAGISRSATFVLAYLIESGRELPDAFTLLKQQHPIASPLPAMWQSLLTYYDLPYDMGDVYSWMREHS